MKVILYMAMTVNGMIAKENDETPWSNAEWKNYAKKVKECGALIVGRRTYEIMKKSNELKKIGNPFTVVVTSVEKEDNKSFVFVRSPKDALEIMKKKRFHKVLLGGGSMINASFMKAGLVDEIYLDVEPVVFGRGIKLFSEEDFEAKLKLIGTKKISKNEIQLHYKVIGR
ncbi:MAG: dihydrofolate reductase family protein [Candidatus Aenigmatarchaeota archaeon]